MDRSLPGGCHCGNLRYRVLGTPFLSGYCHCSICRRTTGAPVLAFAAFADKAFAWEGGEPARYKSSATGTRHFCPRCGAQVAYTDSRMPGEIAINTATLDDPDAMPPTLHMFADDRIAWFHLADDLPRHAGAPPAA